MLSSKIQGSIYKNIRMSAHYKIRSKQTSSTTTSKNSVQTKMPRSFMGIKALKKVKTTNKSKQNITGIKALENVKTTNKVSTISLESRLWKMLKPQTKVSTNE